MKIHLLADIITSPGFVRKVWDSFLFYAYYQTLRLASLMISLDSSTFCPVYCCRSHWPLAHLVLFTVVDLIGPQHILSCLLL